MPFQRGNKINLGRERPDMKGEKNLAKRPEIRKKISKAMIGKARDWLMGKKHSEQTKKKLSIIAQKKGFGKWNKGRKLSEETKRKIGETIKGGKNHFWKGGITPLVERIRHCFKNRQWISDVFTRDDYTCQLCGKRGGELNADHYPKSFSKIFWGNNIKSLEEALVCEEFWNINNGRTLCEKCHTGLRKNNK